MNKIMATLLVGVLSFAGLAFAQAPIWQIVKGSTIKFTGTQNNAPISAEFKKFDGDIQFDPNNLKESKVKLTVDMDSVTAGFAELATMLKTMDWFDTTTFPHATFESTDISADKKGYLVKGELKVRDKKSPISIDVVVDENTPTKMKLHGTTQLSRTAFGVGQGDWADTSDVKDEVKVEFNLELSR